MNNKIIFLILFLTIGFPQDSEIDTLDIEADSLYLESDSITNEDQLSIKDSFGFNVGLTASVGLVNGAYITNTPVGGSLVVTTPYGFKVGPLDLTLSAVLGSYNGEGDNEPLDALLFGAGANATLFKTLFSESHVGLIGAGLGIRNFSGLSLEQLLKSGLNLPVNVLVGAEGFLATKADDRAGNSTYWGGLGVRLDYNF